jgi:thiol-disulfide isomerase/thioredoxin
MLRRSRKHTINVDLDLTMFKLGFIIISMFASLAFGAPIDKFVIWDKDRTPPPLNVTTLSGEKVSLTDFSNQTVVLNFWATWCAPCLKEIPSLLELRRQLPKQEFAVLFVNYGETKDRVESIWTKIGGGATTLIDPELKDVKVWIDVGLPTTIILNQEHQIIYKIVGDIDWAEAEIVDLIKKIR